MTVHIAHGIYAEGAPCDLALFTAAYMRAVVKFAEYDKKSLQQDETMEWLKDALSGLRIYEDRKEEDPDADDSAG